MPRTALLFAGQGAQVVGMGADFAATFPSAQALFQRANAALGYDLAHICFHGPEDVLTRTEHAQPGIYLTSWVAWDLLRTHVPTLTVEATAGLSLGEFTALAAAGALAFEDGLRLVHLRGEQMQRACGMTRGTMAAIIGLDEPATRTVCAETGVELANLNCPGQLVLSGPTDAMARAVQLARTRGAKRALPLPVAGAFHSRLMGSAQAPLAVALDTTALRAPNVPVLSNVTARPHGDPRALRDRLVEQVVAPVRWEESIRYLLGEGFTRFIELGPGTALSGFLRRIDRAAIVFNVSDVASLETTVRALGAASSPA